MHPIRRALGLVDAQFLYFATRFQPHALFPTRDCRCPNAQHPKFTEAEQLAGTLFELHLQYLGGQSGVRENEWFIALQMRNTKLKQ